MDIPNSIFPLFSCVGIEIEYMIVDKRSLEIKALADQLLKQLAGGHITNEVECGSIAISNELALHVIELKTNGPAKSYHLLDQAFHKQILSLNELVENHNACLMPTGAHPFFDPSQGVKLWPHGNRAIYDSFDRIFNCSGHGWSNLQSMHINLPFSGDEEFSKLHNAIRVLLPIIPALTASTPFIEGKFTGFFDTRLTYYGKNQEKIPRIAGQVIPEFIMSQSSYESDILQPIYKEISPLDPKGVLQHEWLNSRGAIARFDRNAIEIRIVDSQESPLADIACAAFITAALQYLINETDEYLKNSLNTGDLRVIFDDSLRGGLHTIINNTSFVKQFECESLLISKNTAKTIWELLFEKTKHKLDPAYQNVIHHILHNGNLAERLIKSLGKTPTPTALLDRYDHLTHCLKENALFI